MKKCISIEIVFSGFFYLAYWIYNKRKEDEVLNKRKFVKLKKAFIENRGMIMIGFLYFVYLIVDYFNVPSIFFNVKNINTSFNNNIVTMLIFVITYLLINKKNIEKNSQDIQQKNNQREIALATFVDICKECKDIINIIRTFDNKQFAAVNNNETILKYYTDYPFKYSDIMYSFAQNGIITKDEYSQFMVIQRSYKGYITPKIVNYNNKNLKCNESDELICDALLYLIDNIIKAYE